MLDEPPKYRNLWVPNQMHSPCPLANNSIQKFDIPSVTWPCEELYLHSWPRFYLWGVLLCRGPFDSILWSSSLDGLQTAVYPDPMNKFHQMLQGFERPNKPIVFMCPKFLPPPIEEVETLVAAYHPQPHQVWTKDEVETLIILFQRNQTFVCRKTQCNYRPTTPQTCQRPL